MKKILFALSIVLFAMTSCCKQSSEVKILAHRGNASTGSEFTTDENTLDALRRAQELDFTGCEFDVHLTADDHIVIHHDNKLAPGLSCQGNTLEEIRAHRLPFGGQVPTLQEWLEQAKKTPELLQFIEIKSHKEEGREQLLVDKCLEIIRQMDMVDMMYMLSFKPSTLDYIIEKEPRMRVVYNSSSLHKSMTPDEVKAKGYHAVSYNIQVILNHLEWVEQFRNHGIETFLWMVNSPYTYNLAKELGFDWATTDFYDYIIAE